MNDEKKRLRTEMERKRGGQTPAEAARRSAELCRRASEMPAFQQARKILFYQAFGGEADLSPLIEEAFKADKWVLLPICADAHMMDAYRWKAGETLISGRYGIPEPDGARAERVAPEDVDLILLPGVAFDRQGMRLGRGAGYYDRYLAQAAHAAKVGVGYAWQVREAIPYERHDRRLDWIVTDAEVIDCRKGAQP